MELKDNPIKIVVDSNNKIMIPPSLEKELITTSHILLCHSGINKTYETLRQFFFLSQFKQKIASNIQSCKMCQLNKSTRQNYGKVSGYIHADGPLQKVSSDIFGPIDLSNFGTWGKGFIITFTDVFSRFTKLAVLENIKGENVVQEFKEKWVSEFGQPNIFHSDQGRQYTSAIVQKYFKENGVKQTFSSTYNPTGNSISERINQTISTGIKIGKGNNIYNLIKNIEFAINNSNNRTIGYSPNEIIHRKSYFDLFQKELQISNKSILNRIKEKATMEETKRNKIRKEFTYELGSLVLLKRFHRNKTDSLYEGPFTIKQIMKGKNNYLIENERRQCWVNIKRLKPYFS